MKSLSFMLSVVLISLSTVAFAQSDAKKPVAQSDAQKSFDKLKTLAGSWEGHGTTTPPSPEMPDFMQVSLRVTSTGNALLHEMKGKGKPGERNDDDPNHPVTMFYVDGDRLLLTHYCDAGNRPRMAARVSPDGKTVEFDFVDVAGGTQYGHMHHALFTIIDANHHIEDWTYIMPGDKPMQAHMDLQRIKTGSGIAGN